MLMRQGSPELDDFLAKPLDVNRLFHVLHTLIYEK